MPNHKSAIKRHKQSIKRRSRNRIARSTVRTAIKKVHEQVATGDLSGAKDSLRVAESLVARAASKGMYHPRAAGRKISRLATFVAKAKDKKA